MEYNVFKKIYDTSTDFSKCIDQLYKLKIDCINSPFVSYFSQLEDICIKNEYGDEGYDWYSWFVYEKMSHEKPEELCAYDKEGNKILNNLKELYEFLEENYKKNLDKTKK